MHPDTPPAGLCGQQAGLAPMTGEVQPAGYVELLDAVKREVSAARARAARVVNTELVGMYWRIGQLILDRQADEGWGARVIDRLATDLRTAFPGARGFSRRNLHYMRALAEAYPAEIVQQPAAQLPWGQLMVLLDKVADPAARNWYAGRAAAEGWSRPVLETMVASNLHRRQGSAPSNFPATLPAGESDLAQEITRDPYVFDFVRLQPGYRERELQAALLAELRSLLLALGTGFAIVGEQYPLAVGDSEFFVDLLCYHTRLHRYVVLELKLGRFDPRDLGQLQFYVQAVDGQVRDRTVDAATVGILLVADRDETVVQYALQSSTAPVAVSRYELPEEVRRLLPDDEQLRRVAHQVTLDRDHQPDTVPNNPPDDAPPRPC